MKKRARLDIYRDILEVLKRQPEGVLITRLSYGAGLPIDRVKPMLDGLAHCELVVVRVKGDPLQSSLVQRRFYYVTKERPRILGGLSQNSGSADLPGD